MVPDGTLEELPEPHDGGQTPAVQRLVVQLHRQQACRRDGQLPSPNVLPRAEDDEAAAQALSSVLPVVLEQADYEQVYSDTWWRKLKQGTGVKGVFWDPEQRGGSGRDRHPAHEPADALLGTGRGRYSGVAPLFLAESGRHGSAGKPLAPAGRTHCQRAGRAALHPRRRP